jgi:hypothetical protein
MIAWKPVPAASASAKGRLGRSPHKSVAAELPRGHVEAEGVLGARGGGADPQVLVEDQGGADQLVEGVLEQGALAVG